MSDRTPPTRGRKRRTGLRRSTNVESVVIEEPFGLTSSGSSAESAITIHENPNESKNGASAGEGCYISATVHNRRYYGVLVDQSALKIATKLWVDDQASSLDLNRRMEMLLEAREKEKQRKGEGIQTVNEKSRGSLHGSLLKSNTRATAQAEATTTQAPTDEERGVINKRPREEFLEENDPMTCEDASAKKTKLEDRPNTDGVGGQADTGPKPDDTVSGGDSVVSKRSTHETQPGLDLKALEKHRGVQKFKFVSKPAVVITSDRAYGRKPTPNSSYRLLIATYCNLLAAADDDAARARKIKEACDQGGNFCDDDYYYQYEVVPQSLTAKHYENRTTVEDGLRVSQGFHTFLQNTPMPAWFPLSNLQLGPQNKMLELLHLKRNQKGDVIWEGPNAGGVRVSDGQDDKNISRSSTPLGEKSTNMNTADIMNVGGTVLPMKERSRPRYQIGVIGGGISGLACSRELLRLLEEEDIDAEIVLMESRSVLGGRILTDSETFSFEESSGAQADGTNGPAPTGKLTVDLGASWIHGIDENPLAALALSAGATFVSTSEQVQMLTNEMQLVDKDVDKQMGKLFDDLLDKAADDCWAKPEGITVKQEQGRNPRGLQRAVRWYSSVFAVDQNENKVTPADAKAPLLPSTTPPPHRVSSDRSIDYEVGRAIANYKFRQFSKLGDNENRLLYWHTKNVEYALGANIEDLSMRYWDSDERHSFDGAHVLLKEGYSKVIEYMYESLQKAGPEKFVCHLNFPVGTIEYARKSSTIPPRDTDRPGRYRRMMNLSDTCSVSSQDGTQTKYFDFLVCTLPLGVLKESVQRRNDTSRTGTVSFHPPLPFSKVDAISNVGFGLLNKIFLQFPSAFWREPDMLNKDGQTLYGNASGIKPHYYMFFDVGMSLEPGRDSPAVLMTLVSGKEAVDSERLSDESLVEEVMAAIKGMFPHLDVPQPTKHKITRWGRDRWARGSYTFLPPGATDQDFQILQSSICGAGDSLLVEGAEPMRLFFAGEHTTALYPSMAHGAMLSGIRAAKEVVSTLKGVEHHNDKDDDRLIPLPLFRHENPSAPLECSLCHKIGGQVREGSLLVFKRGHRQSLVHTNCAEYSPEVEVVDGKWRNVVKAVFRSRTLVCTLCSTPGASVGCTFDNCLRTYHCSCSEDTGWRFDRDGKVFFCDVHRKPSSSSNSGICDRISLSFFRAKQPSSSLVCSLCGQPETEAVSSQMLAFQNHTRTRRICVHEDCIKNSNLIDTKVNEESRMGLEYTNVFTTLDLCKDTICTVCQRPGAATRCVDSSCGKFFHVRCAASSGWNFKKRGNLFQCESHRSSLNKFTPAASPDKPVETTPLQHDLFAQFGSSFPPSINTLTASGPAAMIPGVRSVASGETIDLYGDSSDSDGSFVGYDNSECLEVLDLELWSEQTTGNKRLVRVQRQSQDKLWNLSFKVCPWQGDKSRNILVVAEAGPSGLADDQPLRPDDVVLSINGVKIGSPDLKSLRLVLFRLKQEVDILMRVSSKPSNTIGPRTPTNGRVFSPLATASTNSTPLTEASVSSPLIPAMDVSCDGSFFQTHR